MEHYLNLLTTTLVSLSLLASFDILQYSSAVSVNDASSSDFPFPIPCYYRSKGRASCNGDEHFGMRHKYIPPLPKHIHSLEFRKNGLTALDDKNFFLNVTQITTLDLSKNHITRISPSVFDLMPHLNELILDYNRELSDIDSLRNILATPSLSKVYASFCNFSSPPSDFLDGVVTSNVKVLFMLANDGFFNLPLDLSALCHLQHLEFLNLNWNQIPIIALRCVFPSLTELLIKESKLWTFLPSCRSNDTTSLFPQLTTLNLTGNHIWTVGIEEFVCLPNLKMLNLARNQMGLLVETQFTQLFPSLLNLDLTETGSINGFSETTFKDSPLQVLKLANNDLDFSRNVTVKSDTFSTCKRLRDLTLDDNDFSLVTDERFQLLFSGLPLQRLSLRNTLFNEVSVKTFAGFTRLETLDLSNNKMTYILDGTFDHLVSLRYLLLSQNKIHTVSPQSFGQRLMEGLIVLRLDLNPFQCTCDLLWFRAKLQERPELFERNTDNVYRCSNTPSDVPDFVLAQQACLLSTELCGYIITLCATIAVALTTFLLLFSYRWHLRLLLYEAFGGRDEGARRRRLLQNNFDYDVFVSYASEDLPWVQDHLMPELEGRLGLRLCIHERDFTLGQNIVDNIAKCVESSKKIIMVFSKDFLRSQWCQFELTYCLRHVMDYDDVLIILCVDNVVSCEMTTAMTAVLKTTTYIQWEELDDAIRAFWGRIHIALNEILHNEQRV